MNEKLSQTFRPLDNHYNHPIIFQ